MNVRLSIILVAVISKVFSQLAINNTGFTTTQLVSNLLGTGITATNVSFKGVYNVSSRYQIGAFTATGAVQTNLGFSSGIILTSGNTSDIPLSPLSTHPGAAAQISRNYVSGTMGEIRSSNSSSGQDADVQTLTSPYSYYNAAILEFDFVPVNSNISFRYSFGSEEYMDNGGFINYNCSSYNDKFAFLISGPGISGGQGYSNNAKNIARLSNSAEVSINSVNNGIVGSSGGAPSASNCQSVNSSWIQNMANVEFKGIIYGINYNGNTKTLVASQSGLTAGATYHIRMLISDVSDGAYDSGVFLEAGSFSSPTLLPINLIDFTANCNLQHIELNWRTAYEKDNDSFVIERSYDGINFIEIGNINGSGNSNSIKSYSLIDEHPLTGFNYYRLKQIDYSGNIKLYQIVSSEYPCRKAKDLEIYIYPNPCLNDLHIKLILTSREYIQGVLYNQLGDIVDAPSVLNTYYELGTNDIAINIKELPLGIYYLKLVIGSNIYNKKIIKQVSDINQTY